MAEEAECFFVRTAARADLDAIRALLVETWHDTYDDLMGAGKVTEITDSWHSLPALASRLGKPRSEFVVADSGERIGGVAYAEASEDGKTVELRQLYVLPDLQRKGVGGALLDEIVLSYPDTRRVRLEVEEKNARAIAFYHSRGFHEVDRKTDSMDLKTVVLEYKVET